MMNGDTVRDGGHSYQLGQLLGRGVWGKSYVVRRESDDTLHVLKCPLGAADFRGDVPEAVAQVGKEALLEQARLYEQARHPFLPKLEDRITMPDGMPAIVVPRFAETLERRLAEGMSVGAMLDVLLAVAGHLRQLGVHGGLRPTNILFNDRGEVFLTDVVTPAVARALPRLAPGQPWLPPEMADGKAEIGPGADTWALALLLWRAVTAGDGPPAWPREGLDKAAQVALKDRLIERMKQEDSNPRFHGRLAERTAVLLSRALSKDAAPSPPYRFPRVDELQARLEEVASLVRPQVQNVGKVMVDRPASKPWFTTDEEVAYTVTVGCTAGVEGHEEIGVGIAVFEIDRDFRVKELDLGYTVDKHPSGRYRFAFKIGGLPPGRYKARIAFAIRDSGQPPATTEAEFQVRAAPGWVPRAETAPPQPLPMRPEPETVTQRVVPVASGPVPVASGPVSNGPDERRAAPPTWNPETAFEDNPITAVPLLKPVAPPVPIASLAAASVIPADPPDVAAVRASFAEPSTETESDTEEPAVRSPTSLPEHTRPSIPTSVIPEEEPSWRPRDWTHEPLPGGLRDLEAEPEDRASTPDEDAGPNVAAKVLDQLKNDPYIAVMAGLGLIIAVLLVVFLALRS
jgi:hypothetical protein